MTAAPTEFSGVVRVQSTSRGDAISLAPGHSALYLAVRQPLPFGWAGYTRVLAVLAPELIRYSLLQCQECELDSPMPSAAPLAIGLYQPGTGTAYRYRYR